ncbi:MAG: PIN/TRAM domain-containing protein [Eubacteriales bacterium]
MLKKLLKFLIGAIGAVVGYGIFIAIQFLYTTISGHRINFLSEQQLYILAITFGLICGIICFRASNIFWRHSKNAAKSIENDLQGVATHDIISGTVGLIAGFVIAALLSLMFQRIGILHLDIILPVLSYVILGYLGVVIATKRYKDFANLLSQRGRSGFKKKGSDASPKIFDTSVIIDGRIADIMKTGFIEGKIVIPEFVLLELQHVADSSDSLRRTRGRRGLDILNTLRDAYGVEIYNTAGDKSIEEIPEVDIKLLKLAQNIGGKVVTNDYNLNKVAGIKGVEVLNINELANTLKPMVIPGEEMNLFLIKEGKEPNQALAYLDDGTMIVVEEGRKQIGSNVAVLVTSVLQTAAGRMIFAKIKR